MCAKDWTDTPDCILYMLSLDKLVVGTCRQTVAGQQKLLRLCPQLPGHIFVAFRLLQIYNCYLERAKDAVHGDKVQLHDSPLFLTQIAFDLVQCAAHTDRHCDDMAVLACCCQQSLYQGKIHMPMPRLCMTG